MTGSRYLTIVCPPGASDDLKYMKLLKHAVRTPRQIETFAFKENNSKFSSQSMISQ